MISSDAREPTLRSDSALVADEPLPSASGRRSHAAKFAVGGLALIVVLGVAAWFVARRPVTPPSAAVEQVSPPQAAPAAVAPPVAEIRHPIPEEPAARPLPDLAASDQAFVEALAGVAPGAAVAKWLLPQNLIRNVVATVDNIPRHTLARRLVPVAPVPGSFAVTETGTGFVIAAANEQRYAPLVRVLEAVDPQRLVAVYVRWYPRFQEAYRDLGYPNGYFNDRLVEAIDSVLAAPATPAKVAVAQPKILWQFANADYEALPAGQRVMLRMGPDNAARVKARLAAIRDLVAHAAPDGGARSSQAATH